MICRVYFADVPYYSFSIRQKMLVKFLHKAIKELKPDAVRGSVKLVDFTIGPSNDYPVLARVEVDGVVEEVRR